MLLRQFPFRSPAQAIHLRTKDALRTVSLKPVDRDFRFGLWSNQVCELERLAPKSKGVWSARHALSAAPPCGTGTLACALNSQPTTHPPPHFTPSTPLIPHVTPLLPQA
jgi:hypothetical protein